MSKKTQSARLFSSRPLLPRASVLLLGVSLTVFAALPGAGARILKSPICPTGFSCTQPVLIDR